MDLSVLIPARNEMFLSNTIDDVVANIKGNTEVIVVLDGYWPEKPIMDHPKVTLVHLETSIGQRAATNLAAKLSKAKYLMKLDAHCSVAPGFDVEMMSSMQDDWTMVPAMRNLHVFDWVCKKCGDRTYQGITPTECPNCDNKTDFEREIVWISKTNPISTSYCFDAEPHFQYFKEFKDRPEGKGDLTETMSLQGSCFMITRDKYFELNICDEALGSWGSQGIEVAAKTWLSGGQVMVNHKTWYGHMFRTKGGDFGFPYKLTAGQAQSAKKAVRDLFFNNAWSQQVRPISWLLEKFWPVKGWTEEQLAQLKEVGFKASELSVTSEPTPVASQPTEKLTKGLVYYTDNKCNETIFQKVQENINSIRNGSRLISVSLMPINFGENIVLPLQRGHLTMFKQILAGLEAIDSDIVYFIEHDVFYHPSHFDFIPPTKDIYYYNQNVWQIRTTDNFAVYWDCKKTSQLCAYRELLLKHYRERIRRVETEGFSRRMGFEPGSHGRPERIDDYKSEFWQSRFPNLDIRHGKNLTESRWNPSEFRSQRNCKNWKESHLSKIPGWEGFDLCLSK